MPYGYYQLVRFISFVGFGYLAFEANKNKDEKMMIAFIAIALLFQPFIKIALGRFIWNVVDAVVAGFLFISILKNDNTHERN